MWAKIIIFAVNYNSYFCAMKTIQLIHQIGATAAVITMSLLLSGCDGRAKITEWGGDSGHSQYDPERAEVVLSLQSRTISNSSMEFLLLVDNYYYDKLNDLLSLEDAGVMYRQVSEPESSNRKVTVELTDAYTYVTIKNLASSREYIVTPFVVNEDPYYVYYGTAVRVRTKSY